jgi:chemotaxis protein CheD
MTTVSRAIHVQPGAIYLARTPRVLHTILGSCVGVTFWNPCLGTGAICHGVLPRCPPGEGLPEAFRYVDFSIRYLAGRFDKLGADRRELQVKVFGGADVLPIAARCGKPTVGALNCQAALEVLEDEGFAIQVSDLGGKRGRTLDFDTGTGEVFVYRLATLHPERVHL